MAIESVTANPGTSGASFGGDEITGSVFIPYVKLMSGTDAAEDVIPGDASGLLVNLGANNDVLLHATTVAHLAAIEASVAATLNANLGAVDNAVLDSIAANTSTTAALLGGIISVSIDGDTVGIGGGTQYDVDASATGTLTGTLGLGIRDDALSTLTAIEGDFVPWRTNQEGAIWVAPVAGDAEATIGATPVIRVAVFDASDTQVTSFNGGAVTLPATTVAHLAGIETSVGATLNVNLGAVDNAVLDAIAADTSTMVAQLGGTISVSIDADTVGIGGGTQYDVDASATGTLTGNLGLVIRDDSLATLTPADGDFAPMRVDALGALWVSIASGSLTASLGGATVTAILSASSATTVVNLGAVDNAVLDSIDAAVNATLNVNLGAVDNAVLDSIAASVGATLNVNLGAVDNAVLDSIAANTSTTAALLGGQLSVAIDADNVGIGGGTQYNVDASATGTLTGSLGLAVRDDALSTLTPIEGDFVQFRTNEFGALWVKHDATLTAVLGAGSATITANLGAVDNAVLDSIDSAVNGTLSVAGTVQAELSGTDNAVLDAISSAVNATLNVNLGAVDNAVLDAISAAVNATLNVNLGAVDNAVLDSIDTAVNATLDVNLGAVDNAVLDSIVSNIAATQPRVLGVGTNLAADFGIQPRATGGCSVYYDGDADEGAATVKASGGVLYGIHAINTTAAMLFLQLFNVAAASVNVGNTNPTVQLGIPGNADSDGAGFTFALPQGIGFSTAITVAVTTDSEGSAAPATGACCLGLFYS